MRVTLISNLKTHCELIRSGGLGIRGLVRFNHPLLGMALCDSNRYFMEDYSCHKTWE